MNPKKWNNTMQKAGFAISSDKLKDAQLYFEKALKIAERTGDPAKRAETLTLLGLLLISLGDFEESIETFKRAVAISSVVFGDDSLAHAQSMHHLADAYLLNEDYSLAQSNALTSFEIATRLVEKHNACERTNDLLGACLTLLARISYKKGDVSQARKWLEQMAASRGWREEFDELDSKKVVALLDDLVKPKDMLAPISYRIALFAPCF